MCFRYGSFASCEFRFYVVLHVFLGVWFFARPAAENDLKKYLKAVMLYYWLIFWYESFASCEFCVRVDLHVFVKLKWFLLALLPEYMSRKSRRQQYYTIGWICDTNHLAAASSSNKRSACVLELRMFFARSGTLKDPQGPSGIVKDPHEFSGNFKDPQGCSGTIYSHTRLLFYSTTLLLSYFPTLLLPYSPILLLSYSPTPLHP